MSAGAGRDPGAWTSRLRIDPSVFVAPGAVVVGDVSLAAGASVWFNTVVRGDTAAVSVGEESNLQDNTVVHVDEGRPAEIGARVTVGHRAIVHGCVIEDECLVGMGSIVLTGARVGAGSLIGAGALILEGQQIPPGSTVLGSPAKVVGQVKPEHREAIQRGASHYAALARSYRERGFGRPLPGAADGAALAATGRGPLSHLEWGQLVDVLDGSPRWVAGRLELHAEPVWRARPAAERWSAVEVLGHLLEADRDVFAPRLERLLAETHPVLADLDLTGAGRTAVWTDASPGAVQREWIELRARLVARLRPLGPDAWARSGTHSRRGPYTVGAMVRSWVEHDLAHRRQIGAALGEFA